MAFIPYSYENGQPQPSAYLPAAAGTYRIGMGLSFSSGRLAKSVTPEYIALCDAAGVAAGTIIPVMHIAAETVFEAPLSAASSSLKPGSTVDVASDGLSIANTTNNKNVEIISMDGTAAGDLCRVRFI